MAAQNTYTTTTPADGDYVTGVDISDTTQNASGSTRSFLMSAIYAYVRGKILAVANLFTAHNAFGNAAAVDDPSGAGASGTYSNAVTIAESPTDMNSANQVSSLGVYQLLNPSGAVSADAIALDIQQRTTAANAANYGLLGVMNGQTNHKGGGTVDLQFVFNFIAYNTGGGTVTLQEALEIGLANTSGTVTNGNTLRLYAPSGAYGTSRGIKIDGHSVPIALYASDGTTLNSYVDSSGVWSSSAIAKGQTLADAATISWDTTAGTFATVTLGGSRTMAAPSGLTAGGAYTLKVIQDGTGSRTLTWNAVFKWASGTAPTLSTAAGAIDIISLVSDGTNLYGAALTSFA